MKRGGRERAAPGREAAGKACPCCSGRPYAACCAGFHRGEREAPDPVSLMRSRYSAFALGEDEHLFRTLAASHPHRGLPREGFLRMLAQDRGRLRYPSLAILDERRTGRDGGDPHTPGPAGRSAEVLFAAGVTEGGRDVSFVELSDFEHDGTGWRYASGILVPLAELGREPEGLRIDDFLALAAAR